VISLSLLIAALARIGARVRGSGSPRGLTVFRLPAFALAVLVTRVDEGSAAIAEVAVDCCLVDCHCLALAGRSLRHYRTRSSKRLTSLQQGLTRFAGRSAPVDFDRAALCPSGCRMSVTLGGSSGPRRVAEASHPSMKPACAVLGSSATGLGFYGILCVQSVSISRCPQNVWDLQSSSFSRHEGTAGSPAAKGERPLLS